MSTNFYAVKLPTAKEYQEMQEALVTRQLTHLRQLIDNSTKEYHIGKRSGGWLFLFESVESGAPWKENTLDAIKVFISQPNIEIKNEYGVKFTPEQFWSTEVGESLYHDKDHINGADYDLKNPTPFYNSKDVEFTNNEGIRFSLREFC